MSEEKVKLSRVRAKVNYLEFHKTKNTIRSGTYEVEEHDGTISYCAVDNDVFCNWHSWYSQKEYDNWVEQQGRDAQLEANLAWEPDDLAETDLNNFYEDEGSREFNECVRDHELSREVDYHDDEDRVF